MNKVKEIIKSYAISINPTEEQSEIAEERLNTCLNCEYWKSTQVADFCGMCGCLIKIKIFSPAGPIACPERKWTK